MITRLVSLLIAFAAILNLVFSAVAFQEHPLYKAIAGISLASLILGILANVREIVFAALALLATVIALHLVAIVRKQPVNRNARIMSIVGAIVNALVIGAVLFIMLQPKPIRRYSMRDPIVPYDATSDSSRSKKYYSPQN